MKAKVLAVSCCANGAFSLHADEHFIRFFESKGAIGLIDGFIGGNFMKIHGRRLAKLGIKIPTKTHNFVRRPTDIPFTLE